MNDECWHSDLPGQAAKVLEGLNVAHRTPEGPVPTTDAV